MITLTNSARSNNDLGSAQVVVPAGFTAVAGHRHALRPGGRSGTRIVLGRLADRVRPAGTTLIEVATPAVQGAQKVAPGQSLTLSAVGHGAQRPWALHVQRRAKNSASWSDGQLFTLKSPAPVFTVAAAPATQLAFSTQPPVLGHGRGCVRRVGPASWTPTASRPRQRSR